MRCAIAAAGSWFMRYARFLLRPAEKDATVPCGVIVQPRYPREQMFDLELPR